MQKSKDQVRLYYTTPQVCDLLEVDAKLLVQMEKEFPEIRFEKNGAGKKVYRRKYFLMLMMVVQLLKDGFDHDHIKLQIQNAPKKDLEDWAFGVIQSSSAADEAVRKDIIQLSTAEALEAICEAKPHPPKTVIYPIEIQSFKSEILEIIEILKR